MLRSLILFAAVLARCHALQLVKSTESEDGKGSTSQGGAFTLTDRLALAGGQLPKDQLPPPPPLPVQLPPRTPMPAADTGSAAANCALPHGARWCTARSGFKTWQMAVYAGPDPVSNTICSSGSWEFPTPALMGVTSGTQLVDIGANIGWYSQMFAQNGFKVLAIEPMTANRALMAATACANPEMASRITVVAVALSDKAKPGEKCGVYSANINLGDGVLTCGAKERAELEGPTANNANIQHILREEVPVKTLDDVLASSKLDSVDVVKMDIERYECIVLDGGATLFSRFHPKDLMIEVRTRQNAAETVGRTDQCTMQHVMKGGKYTMHQASLKGAIISEPAGVGIFDLYFSLDQ